MNCKLGQIFRSTSNTIPLLILCGHCPVRLPVIVANDFVNFDTNQYSAPFSHSEQAGDIIGRIGFIERIDLR